MKRSTKQGLARVLASDEGDEAVEAAVALFWTRARHARGPLPVAGRTAKVIDLRPGSRAAGAAPPR